MMKKSARDKTAFVTPYGLYQFTRMHFGLSGEPGTFQQLMDKVLKWHESNSAAYLDDIIIYYSRNWEDHIKHIAAVLQSLQEAGLTAKRTKCQFGKAKCIYLGHRVGQGKIIPERSKIEAVRDFAIPTTKKEVRIFLGLAGYYHRFVKNFSTLAAPLSGLVKRKSPKYNGLTNIMRHFKRSKNYYVNSLFFDVQILQGCLSYRPMPLREELE